MSIAVTPLSRGQPENLANNDDLENVAEDVGASYEKTLKTALNHFKAYLEYIKLPNSSALTLETLRKEDITEDFFGKFGAYLMTKTSIKKCDSALANLSKIKVHLDKIYKGLPIFALGQTFYATLRQRITKRYMLACAASNTKMNDHSVPMQEMDLLWLCGSLFRKNTWEGIVNRCLLVLQWQVLGRISEVSKLTFDDIKYRSRKATPSCLAISLSRVKVGIQHEVLVLVHATHWEVCPVHALACLVVGCVNSTNLFSVIAQGSEASYTNRLLALLSTEYNATSEDNDLDWELSEHLTSQSTRSGSATFANEHSEMQTQWIIPRGGWTLEGVQTIFNYVSGTSLTDARVGRALSGWESVSKGIRSVCYCIMLARAVDMVSFLGSLANHYVSQGYPNG